MWVMDATLISVSVSIWCVSLANARLAKEFSSVVELPLDFEHSSTSKGFSHFLPLASDTNAGPTFVNNFFLPGGSTYATAQKSVASIIGQPVSPFARNNALPSPTRNVITSSPLPQTDQSFVKSIGRPLPQTDQSFVKSVGRPLPLALSFPRNTARPVNFPGVTPASVPSFSPSTARVPVGSSHLLLPNILDDSREDLFPKDIDDSEEIPHSSVFFKTGEAETSFEIEHLSPSRGTITDLDFGFAKSLGSATHTVQRPRVQSQPVQYSFNYDVSGSSSGHRSGSSSSNFGHVETRDGDTTRGRYYVQLPDGRTQLVEYYADKTGYHPTITYI